MADRTPGRRSPIRFGVGIFLGVWATVIGMLLLIGLFVGFILDLQAEAGEPSMPWNPWTVFVVTSVVFVGVWFPILVWQSVLSMLERQPPDTEPPFGDQATLHDLPSPPKPPPS